MSGFGNGELTPAITISPVDRGRLKLKLHLNFGNEKPGPHALVESQMPTICACMCKISTRPCRTALQLEPDAVNFQSNQVLPIVTDAHTPAFLSSGLMQLAFAGPTHQDTHLLQIHCFWMLKQVSMKNMPIKWSSVWIITEEQRRFSFNLGPYVYNRDIRLRVERVSLKATRLVRACLHSYVSCLLISTYAPHTPCCI